MAGCLIHRWSVAYTSPLGLRIFEFGIEGQFRRENLTRFMVGWNTLLPRPGREPTTSRTPMLPNKQGVPHPTRSEIKCTALLKNHFKYVDCATRQVIMWIGNTYIYIQKYKFLEATLHCIDPNPPVPLSSPPPPFSPSLLSLLLSLISLLFSLLSLLLSIGRAP